MLTYLLTGPTIEIIISKNKIFVAGIYKLSNFSETDFTTYLETTIGYQISKINSDWKF